MISFYSFFPLFVFSLPFCIDGKGETYWESFSPDEQARIVRSSCSLAQAYYFDRFKPTDNDDTLILLDYLTTWGDTLDLYPLKFYLFNKLISAADGALAEVLGDYCIRWLNHDSPYVLCYLHNQPKLEYEYLLLVGEDFSYEPYDTFCLFSNAVLTQFEESQKDYPRFFLEKLKNLLLSHRYLE